MDSDPVRCLKTDCDIPEKITTMNKSHSKVNRLMSERPANRE